MNLSGYLANSGHHLRTRAPVLSLKGMREWKDRRRRQRSSSKQRTERRKKEIDIESSQSSVSVNFLLRTHYFEGNVATP